MKTEEYEKKITEIEEETIQNVYTLLGGYFNRTKDLLASSTAALCNVTIPDMMNDTTHRYNVQARWLFWYAYRYMTNDSYEKIEKDTSCGRKFSPSGIASAITKMDAMISQGSVWGKRWGILKNIIKRIRKDDDGATIKVQVVHPKNVILDIKQQE